MIDSYGNLISVAAPAHAAAMAGGGARGAGTTGAQLKVLIPSQAAGNIIGRGGSIIKQLSELCGCRMQLGDSADPYNTRERMLIIAGNTTAQIVQGTLLVFTQLLSDTSGAFVYSNIKVIYSGPI